MYWPITPSVSLILALQDEVIYDTNFLLAGLEFVAAFIVSPV